MKTNIRASQHASKKTPAPQGAKKKQTTAKPLDQKELRKKHPGMCEPELSEICCGWGPKHRREVAATWLRWHYQLIQSAELIEKLGDGLNEQVEMVFPSIEVQEQIEGKSAAECLALIHCLEDYVNQIRACIGVEKPKPVNTSPAQLLALN